VHFASFGTGFGNVLMILSLGFGSKLTAL